MIKIGIRHNLIYLIMLIIFNFCRKVELIIMDKILYFNSSLLLTLLMFLGELISGFIIYKYEISFLPKKRDRYTSFMGIKLIEGNRDIKHPDSTHKIYILLFMASYFDFVEFIASTFYLGKIEYLSKTLEMRLSGFLTISSALFFYYVLKFPIFKHQIFSLFIIFVCLIVITVSEYFFQIFNQERNIKEFTIATVYIFLIHFFNSLLDSIEKYLLEFDFLNPFQALMIEGFYGTILTVIYSFIQNPFKEIIDYFKNNSVYKFIILLVLLLIYLLLSGGRNAYRVATNKIYSPMAKTLADYFLNPLLIVYYYIFEEDFKNGKNKNINIVYFIINTILSIIIDLSGCIYNEFFILYCCDLEYNTHRQVSFRAETKENITTENNDDNSDKSNDS